MKKFTKGSVLLLQLDSRLDANNAADTERQIMQEIEHDRLYRDNGRKKGISTG